MNCTLLSEGKASLYSSNNAPVVDENLRYEDDRQTLLQQIHYRHQRCISRRWKVLLWIGVSLLVLGILAVVVSYLIPSTEWITPSENLDDDVQIINKLKECNIIIYLCKVIGFLIFCIGSALLTMALIFSSCLTCYTTGHADDHIVNESLDFTDTTDRPCRRSQVKSPASCLIQDMQVSEMLRQQINTEALSATLI